MRRIKAFRGEFGIKIRYHVPKAHYIASREPCLVEIERGEEALYPAAARWEAVDRTDDLHRKGSPALAGQEQRFVPAPYIPQSVGPVNVVICPRGRAYGPTKNWDGWGELSDYLQRHGLTVYAAGAPDSSQSVPGVPQAWDNERFLDASIEAMRKADVVVATDSGLAHLAVLCGAPLILVTYRGLVAKGQVVGRTGRTLPEYWPIKIAEYYEKARHTDAPIIPYDGWDYPTQVGYLAWLHSTTKQLTAEEASR